MSTQHHYVVGHGGGVVLLLDEKEPVENDYENDHNEALVYEFADLRNE